MVLETKVKHCYLQRMTNNASLDILKNRTYKKYKEYKEDEEHEEYEEYKDFRKINFQSKRNVYIV